MNFPAGRPDVEAGRPGALVPNGDAEMAVAAFAANMRQVFPVASGSGVTIGYSFEGAPQRTYPTERAAYLALTA